MRRAALLTLLVLSSACGAAPPAPSSPRPAASTPSRPAPAAPEPLTPVFQRRLSPLPSLVARWRRDGAAFAVADHGRAQIRDGSDGRLRAELDLDAIVALEWTPSGDALAILTQDARVHLWSMAGGAVVDLAPASAPAGTMALPMGRFGGNLAFAPDGRHLVASLNDHGFVLWNLERRAAHYVSDERDDSDARRVRGFAWSPDGSTLAAVLERGGAALLDPDTGATRQDLQAAAGFAVFAVAYAPDGRLALGGEGGVRVLARGSTRAEATQGTDDPVQALAWDPAGKLLAVSAGIRSFLYAPREGALTVVPGAPNAYAFAFSSSGDRVALLQDAQAIRIVDVASRATVGFAFSDAEPDPPLLRAFAPTPYRDTVSPPRPGIYGIASGALEVSIPRDAERTSEELSLVGARALWRRRSHAMVVDLARGTVLHADDDPFDPRVLSPDGTKLLHTHRGTAVLEDAATGAPIGPALAVEDVDSVPGAIWSPRGTYVSAETGRGKALAFTVLDAQTGAVVARIPRGDSIDHLAWSPDERSVSVSPASTSGYTVQTYGIPDGKRRFELAGTERWSPGAWSLDGRSLAVNGAKGSGVYDAATGALVAAAPGWIRSAWSPDGGRLVVKESGSGGTCIWNVATGACGVTLALTNAEVDTEDEARFVWSPGGTLVVRRPGWTQAEIYDAATGALRLGLATRDQFAFVDERHFLLVGQEITVVRLDDRATVVLAPADDDRSLLALGPDGTYDGEAPALARLVFRGRDVVAAPLHPATDVPSLRRPGLFARWLAGQAP